MFLLKISSVRFPRPTNISINMMPFILGDKASIPEEYRSYWPLIKACQIEKEEKNKVGYLSIVESLIPAGQTQRRPGIHTDGHGPKGGWGGGWGGGNDDDLPKPEPSKPQQPKPKPKSKKQGLYLASNIENSCRAWNLSLDAPGKMGDCEALRAKLEEIPAIYMNANELYWMTDQCPHESLPMQQSALRQWFRVVTSAVDLWYAQHSTPNRLGIRPSCKILTHNKFEKEKSLQVF